MPSFIRALDDKTINQIAAGEVIENSASCIKELVENAIDAKATIIEVRISHGGRRQIEVIDNGVGMSLDDALLSLERHATSKITNIEDLDSILSMGFRGEALASIASISKLKLTTCDESGDANQVVCHGGKIISSSKTSGNQGTIVDVQSLFYNVKARREYQKSIQQDTAQITKVLSHLALAHPKIAFKFVSDNQEQFHLHVQEKLSELENLKWRIEELFGFDVSTDLIEINSSDQGIALRGFLGSINQTRASRLNQHFFINKRLIQSEVLSNALKLGYSTRVDEKRFAICFLYIDINPKVVDVNVHPQKKEVRFKDSKKVQELISSMINIALSPKEEPNSQQVVFTRPLEFSKPIDQNVLDFSMDLEALEKEVLLKSELSLKVAANIIGIFNPYILIDGKSCKNLESLQSLNLEGLLLVHHRRAQEAILYQTLITQEKDLAIQTLLLPVSLTFSKSDAMIIEQFLPLLNDVGISIRALKGSNYIIDALPDIASTTDAENLIEKILFDIKHLGYQNLAFDQKKQLVLKVLSKAAASFKKIDQIYDANYIVEKLLELSEPLKSPRGKPIIISLSYNELTKKFN